MVMIFSAVSYICYRFAVSLQAKRTNLTKLLSENMSEKFIWQSYPKALDIFLQVSVFFVHLFFMYLVGF